jgi:UDP-galactopyranose mutase
MYDYLIIGTGLFGSVFAHEANKHGKKCLVIDKRKHIGGNIYTKEIEGIQVHMYGPHIFHTDKKYIWDYVNQFAEFNRFTYSPIAKFGYELYNLPFNMNTFSKMWGISTPAEAKAIIDKQVKESGIMNPANLEEQAISLVGFDIYEKLIKGYTEKQWGRRCIELPSFIIRRLPVRLTYDNNYFDHSYQGIPKGGYSQIVEKMLNGIEVKLETDYFANKESLSSMASKTIYTGMIDEFFGYRYGKLEYRSLRFEVETLDQENYQGVAVVNYTEKDVPWTRIIEHKHFEFGKQEKTIVTKEFAKAWDVGQEPYYPINDERNNRLYEAYRGLAAKDSKVIFGGRLGSYCYLDMDQVVENAMDCAERALQR